MGTVETIEYYANCPSCGAANDGTGACDYCGASLVKSRKVADHSNSIEDVYAKEDARLLVVQGKSGEVSNFLKIFCPLFGGIFLLVPTSLFNIFLVSGFMEPWLFLFFSLFWIIGIAALIPFLVAVHRRRKCRNGKAVTGIVRGYENGDYLINNEPVKIIRIRIEGERPYIVELSTRETKCKYALGTKLKLMTDDTSFIILGAMQPLDA